MPAAIAAINTILKMGAAAVGDSGDTTYNTVARVLSINGPTATSDQIDVTNQDSTGGFREFIAGLRDFGELTFDINFLPTGETTHGTTAAGLIGAFDDGKTRNFQLQFPDGVPTTWGFVGSITGFEASSNTDEQLKASVTVKLSGKPDFEAVAA